ncbi:MAG TPA: PAS domain-containing protein, partial [Acidimicrobiia bacterium]|nr:PAS domain-containing protein [Acidimicrobiia bacterium]
MTGNTPGAAEIIELLPDAIVVLDAHRTIMSVNEAAAELLARPAKDLLGASADEMLEPRTRDGKLVWADGWPRACLLTRVRRIPEQEIDVTAGNGKSVRVAVTGRYR